VGHINSTYYSLHSERSKDLIPGGLACLRTGMGAGVTSRGSVASKVPAHQFMAHLHLQVL
jgi:hypothetical protein